MADLRWNSVNANFNDVNSAMGNSLSGLSQAGTIFGDLRKSILDEEQRAVDNAHREKVFDENVRQFGLNYALDEDKLFETGRHNKESERLIGEGHDVQREGIQADAPLKEQETIAAQLSNSNTRDTREAQDAAENANIYFNLPANDRQSVNKQMEEQITALQQSIPNIADPKERISAERQLSRMQAQYKILTDPFTKETLTTNERANRINSIVSLYTGQNFDATRAVSELELGQKLQTREDNFEKEANQSVASAMKGMYAADQDLIKQAVPIARRMATHDGEFDWKEYNRFLALLQNPHTNADGKQSYDKRGIDLWGMVARETADALKEYINSNGTKGPLAGVHAVNEQRIMKERAEAEAAASSTGDKPDGSDKQNDNVNPATLTPLALDYREKQLLQDLPKVENITIDSPEVQARKKQLLRARYANMPEKEIPASELESLDEEVLQEIREKLQQKRAQVTRTIDIERGYKQTPLYHILKYFGLEEKY